MKVKDNVKFHKIKENILMNSRELQQNQQKKIDISKTGEINGIKNIACINSFISYFLNQEKE